MKGLTVWQPWASLIARGWKHYEFRVWPGVRALEGKRIAIHAGTRKPPVSDVFDLIRRIGKEESFVDPEALPWLESIRATDLPRGVIVATAIVGKTLTPAEVAKMAGFEDARNDSDRAAHFNYAWPLIDVWTVPNIPCRGAQGFWPVPAPVVAEIEKFGS